MKIFQTCLFFFLCLPLMAQKDTEQVIGAVGIDRIVLASDEVYKITLRTVPGNDIRISTESDGEYYNDIGLESEVRNGTLYLNSRYRKILQSGYDKLSAHKVFSMEVELEVPAGLAVEINSNVASAYITGTYDHVLIQLKEGSCYFQDFKGNAVVNTYDGNIQGTGTSMDIEASSRHGKVEVPKNPPGIHKMVLTSINGDIMLTETK